MLPGMDICFFQGHRALSLNSKLNLASAAGFMTRALSPFYGWWIVAASAIILLLAGGVGYYTFGAFFTPLVDEFEWNRAQISLSMSIMGLVGLAGPLFGMWVDRYGARRVMIPGALVMGLSFACLGFTSSIYYFYAMYFVVAVGQMAILHIPVLTLVSQWFEKRRGLATGISVAGLGLGGMIMLPLSAHLISVLGWQWTYRILGAAVCAVLVPLIILVIRDSPRDIGMLPDGEKHVDREGHQRMPLSDSSMQIPRWTLSSALRTPTFWLLVASFTLVFVGTSSLIAHAVPFFVGQGFSNQVASTILGSTVGVSILGRISTGHLSDRVPVKYVAALFFMLQAGGLLLLIVPGTQVSIPAFVIVLGLAMGGLFVLEPLVIREYFGLDSFASIYGGLWAFETLGWGAGPYITGYIFDKTGSYNTAFIAFIFATLLATVLVLLVRRPRLSAT
ncbi:MAG: MFS transporter [Dehalococcoidia bacterium]|nr:MAG: MFS transporter [Dehalococcoidia bacterium]